jgi:predicted negative regulator of RcsB-dependent stress response
VRKVTWLRPRLASYRGSATSEVWDFTFQTVSKLASALRDEAFLEQLQQAQPPQSQAWRPQEQEVTLLQRLGDLAAQKGDTAAASNYYKQALDVTRNLSASTPVP